MKTLQLAVALSLACSSAALCQVTADAETVNNARVVSNSSARDGFTRANADTLLTRNGVTEKVTREVVLRNGLRVAPDGTAMLPNGTKVVLRANQILTLDGAVEDTALTPAGVAPMPSGGSATAGARPDVGLSMRDGITGSNNAAFITRNGVTQQVGSDLKLESGIRVQPNGTITLANGTRINLKPGQRLSFDGILEEKR
ncbi:MAG TPA: DUF6799 domain-containing protein [Chthoniobacteraceae bacterium]|jgi:hypothetical protein|nr:DUF6799 domain-containing protein [Chthoniobacteraceae bacterium]